MQAWPPSGFSPRHIAASLSPYTKIASAPIPIATPPHLPVEVTNVIRRRVARHFITYDEGCQLLRLFTQFSVRLVIPPGLYEQAFDLAETLHRPTVYDTHYVALANILGCDLWTADEGLLNAIGDKLPHIKWIRDYPT